MSNLKMFLFSYHVIIFRFVLDDGTLFVAVSGSGKIPSSIVVMRIMGPYTPGNVHVVCSTVVETSRERIN